MIPILRPYDAIGSTDDVYFETTKVCFDTGKSHINKVAQDSNWETELAQKLELMPEVVAYAKNQGLNLKIPYTFEGRAANYVPDFLIRLRDPASRGDDDLLTLLLEVSGEAQEGEAGQGRGRRGPVDAGDQQLGRSRPLGVPRGHPHGERRGPGQESLPRTGEGSAVTGWIAPGALDRPGSPRWASAMSRRKAPRIRSTVRPSGRRPMSAIASGLSVAIRSGRTASYAGPVSGNSGLRTDPSSDSIQNASMPSTCQVWGGRSAARSLTVGSGSLRPGRASPAGTVDQYDRSPPMGGAGSCRRTLRCVRMSFTPSGAPCGDDADTTVDGNSILLGLPRDADHGRTVATTTSRRHACSRDDPALEGSTR